MRLALLHLWREKHHAEFRILAFALWLAVFAVTTLCCLTQSMRATLLGEAADLLGADMIIESTEPLDPALIEVAQTQGLKTSFMVEFFSMLIAHDKMQLASVSAFDAAFPLRGELIISNGKALLPKKTAPPPVGEIWIEEDLAIRLNIKINEKIKVGYANLNVTGLIQQRPVAVSGSSALAPVAYINAQDLATLGVLQAGSRATYRLLLAGPEKQLNAFKVHFKEKGSEVRWITPQTGRPSVNRMLENGKQYLAIIMLLQVLLAGTAIAMCAHQYSLRQQPVVALWRCLGASNHAILKIQFSALLLLALIVLFISIASGYGVAALILHFGKQWGLFSAQLGWHGVYLGTTTGLLMLIGFASPPLMDLKKVSPIQIVQRLQIFSPRFSVTSYGLSIFSLIALFIYFLDESGVALRLSLQMVGVTIIVFCIAYGLWYCFTPLTRIGPLSWRFGVAYMVRHQWPAIIQWLVFTLVIMLLLLAQIIQWEFLPSWQAKLPAGTPNYFLMNIQQEKVPLLQQWFDAQAIHHVKFYPVVRGRMSHVNGEKILSSDVGRALNLTWMRELPADNQVIQGISWDEVPDGQALLSVEKGFAERQHLKLNDTLTFQIAEEGVTGKIVQFRTLEWETFKPNFFVIFPPQVIDKFPHMFITSFYLPPEKKFLLFNLAKEFVEASVLDIDAFLHKARQIIGKITFALDILLGLVFILGVVIMYASMLSTLKDRLQESAMLQVLGASKKLIAKVLLIEFSVLGLLSSVVASTLAYFIARDLAFSIFNFSLQIPVKWFLLGITFSTLLIILCGMVGVSAVFRESGLKLLRAT